MKVKLLKRIRKRFGYYFRKSDRSPVLVDHQKQIIICYTDALVAEIGGYKDKKDMLDNLEVGVSEYKWRTMKDHIYKQFGRKLNNVFYRQAKQYASQKTKYNGKS